MASEPVLDIESLCAPISEDQPAGPFWRDDEECSSKLFPEVNTAHRDARKNERNQKKRHLFKEGSIERQKLEEPDWGAVVESGKKLLVKSKDLWVATWVAEASAREEGFAGLRDGIKLIHELCKRYWDHIHPRPDKDEENRNKKKQMEAKDDETRNELAQIAKTDEIRNKLAQIDGDNWAELVLLMPITKSGYSTADYDMSTEMEGLDSESDRDAYRSRGIISTVDFNSRISESGVEFLVDQLENATAASIAYDELTEFLDERCGFDAPASNKVKENFEQLLTLMRELGEPYLPPELLDQASTVPGDDDTDSQLVTRTSNQTDEGGWNRQLAFKEIQKQAELFEKYEPNSPVASILRHAVKLGKLNWHDLISGLMSKNEKTALIQVLKQTGFLEDSDFDGSDE